MLVSTFLYVTFEPCSKKCYLFHPKVEVSAGPEEEAEQRRLPPPPLGVIINHHRKVRKVQPQQLIRQLKGEVDST